MNEFIAYGFANTNRSDTEPENTLAYKQLDVFNADKIVVVNNGKIAEIGTHNNLLTKENGIYSELYKVS